MTPDFIKDTLWCIKHSLVIHHDNIIKKKDIYNTLKIIKSNVQIFNNSYFDRYEGYFGIKLAL